MGELQSLLKNAAHCLKEQDYRQCHKQCLEVITLDPDHPEPYYLLGILTADHKNYNKAIDLFGRAISRAPDIARYHAQQAKCFTALTKHQEAVKAADRAAALSPPDAFTLDTIGVVYSLVGRHRDSINFFRKASAIDPDNANYHYNLGSALQFSGDFENARKAYMCALAINPDDHRIYTSLTSLQKQTVDANYIPQLQKLFSEAIEPDIKLHIGHALAKSHEDLGNYDLALDWLEKAKRDKRKSIAYSQSFTEELFAASRSIQVDVSEAASHNSERNPIFVVGMPRTGTTLADRILSSHSDIASVGELSAFGIMLKKAAATPSPFVLDSQTLMRASEIDLAAVGKAYLDETDRLRGNAAYFVDKMPLNFFYAPILLAALPTSKIIVLRRSPMDACLSNYRQLFRTSYSYYNYSYDLLDTAHYYRCFDQLMSHYEKTLPSSRFLQIKYEDIVFSQEKTTRALLAFCGVAWQDDCLNFHENESPVATASSVQVRSPIYSSSIGRWKRYGNALERVQHYLKQHGIRVE